MDEIDSKSRTQLCASMLLAFFFATNSVLAVPVGYTVTNHDALFRPADLNIFGRVLSSGPIDIQTGQFINPGDAGVAISDGAIVSYAPNTFPLFDPFRTVSINGVGQRFGDLSDRGTVTVYGTSRIEENFTPRFYGNEIAQISPPSTIRSVVNDADGSVLDLASYGRIDSFDANERGDVVFVSRQLDENGFAEGYGIWRVLSGDVPELIVPFTRVGSQAFENGSAAPSSLSRPIINNNGDVAFFGRHKDFPSDTGTGQGGIIVYRDGEVTAELSVRCSADCITGGWDFNDRGDIASFDSAGGPGRILLKDTAGAIRETSGFVYLSNESQLSLNNSGTIAVARFGTLDSAGVSLISPAGTVTKLLSPGDQLLGETISMIGRGVANTIFVKINDAGQVGVDVGLDPLINRGTNFVVLNPLGTSPDNPILPLPSAPGTWEFASPDNFPDWSIIGPNGTARPAWFDPEVAVGYVYEMLSADFSFAGVEIPFDYGDGLFDLFLWDAILGDYVDSDIDLTTGTYFDFLSLVSDDGLQRFSIRGIELAANVDPLDPEGFVTGLTFIGEPEGAAFTMTALTSPSGDDDPPIAGVPVPGTLGLIALGLVTGGSCRRLIIPFGRRKKT